MIALVAALCAACASPRAPTVEGGTCTRGGRAAPLLSSFDSAAKQQLRVALAASPVIVTFACDSVRILPDCHAAGGYTYAGVTPEDQPLRVTIGDASANAPPALGGQAAAFDGSLHIVGMHSTTRARITSNELTGTCAGATHFAKRVLVGSAVTGAVCGPSNGRALTANCDDLLRWELVPLDEPENAGHARLLTGVRCPGATVAVGGLCVAPDDRPHQCRPDDARECAEQCDRGDPGSCASLGWMRGSGEGAPLDRAAAIELSVRACDHGLAVACGNAAAFCAEEGDPKRASALYQRGCDGGDGASCNELGSIARDTGKVGNAKVSYGRGCDVGDASACCNLGVLYRFGDGVAKDVPRAQSLYADACRDGELACCNDLALLLESGEGGTNDPAKGRALLRTTCEKGSGLACANLGVSFRDASRVDQNFPRARELFEQSCELGHPGGCRLLGEMFARALGAPRDASSAIEYFVRACHGGDGAGCNEAGRVLLDVEGPLRDPKRATDLFVRACAASYSVGCYNAGLAAEAGWGITPDVALAKERYQRSCTLEYQLACTKLAALNQPAQPPAPTTSAAKSKTKPPTR